MKCLRKLQFDEKSSPDFHPHDLADTGEYDTEDRWVHEPGAGVMVRKWAENRQGQARKTPIHKGFPDPRITRPKQQYSSRNGQNNGQKASREPITAEEQKKSRGPQSQSCQDFAALVPVVGVSRFELEASWSRIGDNFREFANHTKSAIYWPFRRLYRPTPFGFLPIPIYNPLNAPVYMTIIAYLVRQVKRNFAS